MSPPDCKCMTVFFITPNSSRVHHMDTIIDTPYNPVRASNQFDDVLEVEVSTRGEYLLLALELDDNIDLSQRPQLMNCPTSAPVARIPRWQ